MKILITGSTGYVGRHLIKELLKKNYELFAMVRNNNKAFDLPDNELKHVIGDITDYKSFEHLNKDFNIIVHLAFSLFPESNSKVNIQGFDNTLDFAKRNPIKKFIYVSSQLVYGNTPENGIISENHTCNTKMKFGKHQLRAEQKLMDLSKKENFPYIILRPSEIYGGEGGFFKIAQLDGYINGKTPIIGNGNNAISFTYIGDLIQLIINSIEKEDINNHIFNVNTPGTITLNQLVELIKIYKRTKPIFRIPSFLGWIVASFAVLFARIQGKVPFIDYDIMRIATMKSGERSIDKAIEMLNFIPKYQDISSGLIDCYF